MQRDDGVAPIIGATEQLSELGLGHLLGNRLDFAGGFAERLVAFLILGDVEKKPRFFKIGLMLFPMSQNGFERGLFLENGLSFIGVVPEVRLGGNSIQLLDALLFAVDVKGASATARAWLRGG